MKSVFRNGLLDKYGIEDTHRDEETEEQHNKRILTSAFFVVKLTQVDSTPVRIIDGLYIGSIGCAYSHENLIASNISHILCVAGSPKLKFPELFSYCRVTLVDDPSECDLDHLVHVVIPECIVFLDSVRTPQSSGSSSSGGNNTSSNVLVHCYLGVSRCTFVCCAYLMYSLHLSVLEALDMVRSVRPVVRPNSAFMSALRLYEKVLQCDSMNTTPDSAPDSAPKPTATPTVVADETAVSIPFYRA